jgi:hypothetical protein
VRIGKRQTNRDDRGRGAVAFRTHPPRDVSKRGREHRQQPIAEQNEIEKPATDRLGPKHGIGDEAEPQHDAAERQGGNDDGADIVDDAPAAQADALEPDGDGEPHADL